MSTVRIQGCTTFQVEKQIYKLFASNLLTKFDATRLLNKCSRIFNNAVDQIEEVTNEMSKIISEGKYEPNNCKWSTRKEQANNRCDNIK